MQPRKLVVAIDGPSGSGKSTVARSVAKELGLRYLDTGSMYRAVAWLALQAQTDLTDSLALGRLAGAAQLEVRTDPAAPGIRADGHDVTDAVRRPDVTAVVSAVSAVPAVRTALVTRQRQLIGNGGIVVEGRDIGSTVAPDAAVKVFLTAAPEVRATRRARQDGTDPAAQAVEHALAARDAADSTRAASPLRQPADALVIDSSTLDVAGVVAAVTARARQVVGT